MKRNPIAGGSERQYKRYLESKLNKRNEELTLESNGTFADKSVDRRYRPEEHCFGAEKFRCIAKLQYRRAGLVIVARLTNTDIVFER